MRVFDAADSEEVRQWLEKGFAKAAERAMVATGARLVSHIITEVIPKEDPQPVDRGVYRAGWRSRKIKGGAEVYNATPHAPLIEWGVRGENVKIGRLMIIGLKRWIVRKGIADEKDAQGVAFAIANSMRKKGIFNRGGKQGLRILDKAIERLGSFLSEEFPVEIKREFPD